MKIVKKPSTGGASAHVIVDSSALPSGASTEATLALIKAKTDNLDVALSTRTKPADTQPVSGTFWQVKQPISSADGDQATIGTTTGAKVVTDAAGTLQQYLRGLVTLIAGTLTVAGTVTANIGSVATLALDATVAAVRDRLPAALVGGRLDVNVGNIPHTITDAASVTNATLSAETTKVIGTVNQGSSPWNVGGSSGAYIQQTGSPNFNTKVSIFNAATELIGQKTMAVSLPVTLASDDTLHTDLGLQAKLTDTQPVSMAAVPVGAALEATQYINRQEAEAAYLALYAQQMNALDPSRGYEVR